MPSEVEGSVKRAEAESICQLADAALLATRDSAEARKQWLEARRLDPSYPAPCLRLAKLAQIEGKHKEAAKWYETYLAIDATSKDSVKARVRLAELRQVIALTATPDGKADYAFAVALAEARALRNDGDLQGAEKALGRLIAEHPKRFESHVLMGTVKRRSGDLAGALVSLKRALKLCPPEQRAGLGELCRNLTGERDFAESMKRGYGKMREPGAEQAAAAAFGKAWKLRPGSPEAGFSLVGVLVSQAKFSASMPVLERLALSGDADVAGTASQRLRQLRPLAEAAKTGDEAVAGLRGGGAYLQAAQFRRQGETRKALRQAGKAIAALRLPPAYARYYVLRGELLVEAGEHEAAGEDFREALRLAPSLPNAFLGLAAIALARQDNHAAADQFAAAARCAPSPILAARYRLQQASALLAAGEHGKVETVLSNQVLAALKRDPVALALARSTRARARRQSADPAGMGTDLRKAQNLSPSPLTRHELKKTRASGKTPAGKPAVDMSIFE